MSTFEEILDRDGILVYKTKGVSMLPMLRQNRDLVMIEKTRERLKKYDVALYKRGTAYVLHRVIKVRQNDYVILGDNTYLAELVPDEDVIGVLTGFVRNGKEFSVKNRGYLRYVRFWHAIFPVRKLYVKGKIFLIRCLKKLGFRRRRKT